MRFKDQSRPVTRLAAPLALKEAGDDGTFKGYGSVFGVLDSYGEQVAAGAFAASLARHKAQGTMPALLWQHDTAAPIGVYTRAEEDQRGLYVEGRLALETDRGREALALLKMKALNGLSIGFVPVKWEWDQNQEVMTLLEIDLWEVSLVTFPANPAARVDAVKAIDQITTLKDAERALREAGLSRTEARALVARIKACDAEQREAAAGMASLQASAARLLSTLSG